MAEWNDHYVKCPACGFVDQETSDYPWRQLEKGPITWECSECETEFQVEAEFSVAFRSTASGNAPASAVASILSPEMDQLSRSEGAART